MEGTAYHCVTKTERQNMAVELLINVLITGQHNLSFPKKQVS